MQRYKRTPETCEASSATQKLSGCLYTTGINATMKKFKIESSVSSVSWQKKFDLIIIMIIYRKEIRS